MRAYVEGAWRGSLAFLVAITFILALPGCADDADPVGPDETAVAFARGGNGNGSGGGYGGGNGGGPPEGKGGKKGDLYAELVYTLRNVDGLPLLRNLAGEMCLQPVSYMQIPDVDPIVNEADGKEVWPIPLVGDLVTTLAEEEGEVAPCDVQPAYLDFVSEVDVGRLNQVRSPVKTLARALDEVFAKLDNATTLLLDPAGRLSPDGVPIDAPAENMAVHRELVLYGDLDPYDLPLPQGYTGFLDHAASMLAGAADKFGSIDLDLVVYFNRVIGFPGQVAGGMTTITGDGTVGLDGEKYLNYRDYDYDRAETFPGCVMGYRVVGLDVVPFQGSIMTLVFGGQAFTESNVYGFAQRVDDARAVILFEHDTVVTAMDRIGEDAVCDIITP